MKSVLISIRPEWCEKIVSGRKTMELRKSKPKLPEPFKCYIYRTLPKCGDWNDKDGRIIGEFVCDYIMRQCQMQNADLAEQQSLVKREKIFEYANGGEVYGWHISDLKIYDTPKALSEFHRPCTPACNFSEECGGVQDGEHCLFPIKRPPQSWCYVEEV